MSVSYSTSGGVRRPRVRAPKPTTAEQRAEKDRLLHLPHFMRAIKDYPEEFRIDESDFPSRVHVIRVQKGHSPHTKEPYSYAVTIYMEDVISNPRFAPVSIHRVDPNPKRWVNHMGEGYLDPPEGGMHYVWDVNKKARSERLNSIISKAKAKLAKEMRGR